VSAARITVLVPTIGRMEYLPKTRASVVAQTMKEGVEVLILCNGSSEEGRAFVDDWCKTEPNTRVLRSNPRVPMFDNFNLGIRAAKTEYVAFFHDDDEYLPDFLEKMVAALDAHPSAVVAGSNCDFIDEHGTLTEQRRWVPADTLMGRRDYVRSVIARGRNIIIMPGLVYRRSVLGDGFDTNLPIHWGDFILLLQYAERGDIAILEAPLIRVRRHVAQASNNIPFSDAVPMRTKLLLDYLAGYVERFPEDRTMVEELRARIRTVHRVHLLWGWASSATKDESDACLASLDDTAVDAALAIALRSAGALRLRPHRTAKVGLTVARKLAERLRF